MSAAASRSDIDIATVAQAALAVCSKLLHEWFPAGRRKGREFLVGNLGGDPGESLRINMGTGAWADFAKPGEQGGDLVALHAARSRQNQGQAARDLAEKLGLSIAPKAPAISIPRSEAARPAEDWRPMMPVPVSAPPPPMKHFKYGRPVHIAEVRDENGDLLHLICRFEPKDERKQVWPLTYGTHRGRTDWHWKAPPAPRSLYGLPDLAARPDAPVLLVEGEVKRDAAARMLVERAVALSWPNGADGTTKVDLTPLRGRRVFLWPDADEPGMSAVKQLANALRGIAASVTIVPIPAAKGDGWDLADAEREGWSGEQVLEHLARAVETPAGANAKAKTQKIGPAADARDLDGFDLHEDGVALAFAARFKDELRYCHHSGAWFQWNNGTWRREETKLAFSWARKVCRDLARDSEATDRMKAVLARAATAAAVEGVVRNRVTR